MKLRPKPSITPEDVRKFLEPLFAELLHEKRLRSLQDAVLGTIQAASLGISAIGRGLAAVRGLQDKHAIKQVDRWLSNQSFQPWDLCSLLVPCVLQDKKEVFINLDWTDFDGDDQTTLFAAVQTSHGRSEPLLWKTHAKSTLKDRRNSYEDELLLRLREMIPRSVRVTIVADRGFGDQKLFKFLKEDLGFDYIIRLKGNIHVTDAKGEQRLSNDWTGAGGRLRMLYNAKVTAKMCPVGAVVCVKDKGMKDVWCLATSRKDLKGAVIKKLYGKRFSIEETFRDFKDLRLGMGLSWTSVTAPLRRDRLFFIGVLAYRLLTLLGAAGEAAGLDRMLKPNTAKKRVLSLFRQGQLWYERIPMMPDERLALLMKHFNEVLLEEHKFAEAA